MRAASFRLALSCALSKLLAFFSGLGSAFCGLMFVQGVLLLLSSRYTPDGSRIVLLTGLLVFSLCLGVLATTLLRRSLRPYLQHAVAPAE